MAVPSPAQGELCARASSPPCRGPGDCEHRGDIHNLVPHVPTPQSSILARNGLFSGSGAGSRKGGLPLPLGWLLKPQPLPDAHSLWDNVFTSIPWVYFPFQLCNHPIVGIYLWQIKSSPCKHSLSSPSLDYSGVIIQPGMQIAEHRNDKEETGAPPEPAAGNKRPFQRGI